MKRSLVNRQRILGAAALWLLAAPLLTGCPADSCPASYEDNANDNCQDDDGDGFCATCCNPINSDGSACREDCDDTDPWVNPDARELYVDGLDANCDGMDAPPVEICGNGRDDDANGLTDCADATCTPSCLTAWQAQCDSAITLGEGEYSTSFATASNGLSTCGGRERVLQFIADSPGQLELTLTSAANHFFYPLSGCTTQVSSCSSQRSITQVVNPGAALFVVEDSGSGEPFTVNVSFTPFVCGDGVVAGSEECDDGNVFVGDGCDSQCAIEPLSSVCMTAPELLEGTTPIVGNGSTSLVDSSCGYAGAPEHLYSFMPPADGTLHVSLSHPTPATLYVKNVCSVTNFELGCDNADTGAPALLHVAAKAGEPLYVFVDAPSPGGAAGEIVTLFTPH